MYILNETLSKCLDKIFNRTLSITFYLGQRYTILKTETADIHIFVIILSDSIRGPKPSINKQRKHKKNGLIISDS